MFYLERALSSRDNNARSDWSARYLQIFPAGSKSTCFILTRVYVTLASCACSEAGSVVNLGSYHNIINYML